MKSLSQSWKEVYCLSLHCCTAGVEEDFFADNSVPLEQHHYCWKLQIGERNSPKLNCRSLKKPQTHPFLFVNGLPGGWKTDQIRRLERQPWIVQSLTGNWWWAGFFRGDTHPTRLKLLLDSPQHGWSCGNYLVLIKHDSKEALALGIETSRVRSSYSCEKTAEGLGPRGASQE